MIKTVILLLAALAAAPAAAKNFTLRVNDADQLAAIAAAREAHNAACPTVQDGRGRTVPDPACVLRTDVAYLDFVLRSAVRSWEQQHAPAVKRAREALRAAEEAVTEKYEER